jgi:hypothetical protein
MFRRRCGISEQHPWHSAVLDGVSVRRRFAASSFRFWGSATSRRLDRGVKQQLAAVRMLFDWLITGQIVPMNPAAAVRRLKHVVKTGKTPGLEGEEWRKLLASIPDHDLARSARPRLDRHPYLQLCAHHRSLEDEGRGSPAAQGRMDRPAA